LADPTGTSIIEADIPSGGGKEHSGALILSSAHKTQLLE